MEELKDIGKRRKALGLKQTELAKLAGVSQSLIAKLERGLIDVSYSKAQKIFQALEGVEKKEEVTADQIMTREIKSVKINDLVKNAIILMEKLKISQVPVIRGKVCIGSVTEENIIKTMQKTRNIENIKAKEIMDDSFPSLSKKASLNELASLLVRNPAVLIMDKGKVIGIVTKADMLKAIRKK